MKTLHGLAACAVLSALTACSTTNPRWEAADLRTRNEFIVQQHLLYCASRNVPFPVFSLGAKEVEEFTERHADLKLARMEFEAADAELQSVLRRDPEYRANVAAFEKASGPRRTEELRERNGAVYARLQSHSYEYQMAREKRERALAYSNRLTAERIIREYRTQNRILPVAWLGQDRIDEYRRRY